MYYHKYDESYPVQDVLFAGDPGTGLDIAVLKIDVTDAPSIAFCKDMEPKEGIPIYAIGYLGIDMDAEFVNAMQKITVT